MRIVKAISLPLLLAGYWCVCGAAIWWSYDMTAVVAGGFYRQNEALSLVGKMGLIVILITAAAWLIPVLRSRSSSPWRLGWNAAWKTAVLLAVYVLIVLIRRQLWNQSQGINDSAMFLPIVGHVNGAFLSEYQWLIFVGDVIPIAALASGLLFSLQARLSGDLRNGREAEGANQRA